MRIWGGRGGGVCVCVFTACRLESRNRAHTYEAWTRSCAAELRSSFEALLQLHTLNQPKKRCGEVCGPPTSGPGLLWRPCADPRHGGHPTRREVRAIDMAKFELNGRGSVAYLAATSLVNDGRWRQRRQAVSPVGCSRAPAEPLGTGCSTTAHTRTLLPAGWSSSADSGHHRATEPSDNGLRSAAHASHTLHRWWRAARRPARAASGDGCLQVTPRAKAAREKHVG